MGRTIRIETNDAPVEWFGSALSMPLRSRDTGGLVSVQAATVRPGAATPPHAHGREDEAFWIIAGTLTVRVGRGEALRLGAGDFVYVPRGHVHAVANESDQPVTMLTLLSPGAIESAFEAVAADASVARLRAEFGVWGVHVLDAFDPGYSHPEVPDPAPVIVRRAAEGASVWMAGDTYTIKLHGHETGGRFCAVHFDIPPGGGPLPHIHTLEEEFFHLVDGTLDLLADTAHVRATAGQSVVLPRGIAHAFRNETDDHVSMYVLAAPAGFDAFITEVGRPAVSGEGPPPMDDAEVARLKATIARYGVQLVAGT